VLSRLEIYVDGGLSRGADMLKALALGATAVGIGRPFLYSLAYGQEGVEHLIQIYKDELESAMKLSGVTDVDEAHPGMVNTAGVESLVRAEQGHPWIKWMPAKGGKRMARM
jgi:L-lactate dehydrogenase (cytochrome)